jgi:hypothetical protein
MSLTPGPSYSVNMCKICPSENYFSDGLQTVNHQATDLHSISMNLEYRVIINDIYKCKFILKKYTIVAADLENDNASHFPLPQ